MRARQSIPEVSLIGPCASGGRASCGGTGTWPARGRAPTALGLRRAAPVDAALDAATAPSGGSGASRLLVRRRQATVCSAPRSRRPTTRVWRVAARGGAACRRATSSCATRRPRAIYNRARATRPGGDDVVLVERARRGRPSPPSPTSSPRSRPWWSRRRRVRAAARRVPRRRARRRQIRERRRSPESISCPRAALADQQPARVDPRDPDRAGLKRLRTSRLSPLPLDAARRRGRSPRQSPSSTCAAAGSGAGW